MRRLLSIIVSLVTAISFAQQPVELPLWPDGAPNSSGLTGEEQETRPHFVTNVTHPTLTVYHPEKPNGMAIIMCPGGGYRGLGMDGEGYDMAPWFCGQGITYMVLKYRMPNGHWEVPVSDAEQAIRMVRQHAKEWNVDPYKVGLMGASAGGHLTATLATHYNSETRPDFQILLYPVVTMMQVTRGNTRTALLGKNPTMEQIQKFSAELQVTPDTPQAFIALTSDDPSVAPYHGVNYYLALQKNKVPATLHVYPTGGHGWGFQDHFKYKQQWTQELEKWLRDGVVFPENPEPMLRIGKSYLGTKYVANTLDQDGEESLVIRTDAVDCLTFVEYTLAQALGSSFADNLQKYVIGTASSTDILPGYIILPNGLRTESATDSSPTLLPKTVHIPRKSLFHICLPIPSNIKNWLIRRKMYDKWPNMKKQSPEKSYIGCRKANCRKPDCPGS